MDVMDSPLNRAHRCGRRADHLVAKEEFEAAILCHNEAAELLTEALSLTHNEQARLSLELQIDGHVHQQRLIEMSHGQRKPKGKTRKHTSSLKTQCTSVTILQSPPLCWKAAKDDKTRLEEQATAIADLWKLAAILLVENKRLLEEKQKLKTENASLMRNPHEEHQSKASPLPQPSALLQQEIQLLLETTDHS